MSPLTPRISRTRRLSHHSATARVTMRPVSEPDQSATNRDRSGGPAGLRLQAASVRSDENPPRGSSRRLHHDVESHLAVRTGGDRVAQIEAERAR